MVKKVGVFNPIKRQISESVTVYLDKKLMFRDTGIFLQSSADGKLLISSDGSGADDITFAGNVTFNNDVTISGSFSYGAVTATSFVNTGTTQLGDLAADTVTIYGNTTTNAAQNPSFIWLGTGAFTTSSGTNTLSGDVSIDSGKDFDMSGGAGTFATGTGTVSLLGHTTSAANINLLCAAGSSALDFSLGTGVTKTTSGEVTISGNCTVSGSKTFTVGTGLTTLGGDLKVGGNNIVDAGGSSGITFDGAGNTSIDGNLTVVGTFELDDASVTGDFDIQGENLQATTGTLNISKAGSTTTVLGVFAVDEAATFASTVGVTGAATFSGAVTLGNNKADDIKFSGDIIGDGVTNADADFSASSGTFLTTTGEVSLAGNVTILGSKTFATGTGAIGLNGDVTVAAGSDVVLSSTGYVESVNARFTNIKANDGTACLDIADSTAALGIAGSVTIAADKNVSCVAGTTAIDWSVGTGTFDSPTGTNQLNGDVSIAAGKDFDMSAGAGTFATGTGAVSINGSTVLATAKTYTSGTGSAIGGVHTIYRDGAGASAFTLTPGTSLVLGENTSFSGAETFGTGTGLTTIGGDYTITGHFQAQEFSADAFQYPAPGTDWTHQIDGAHLAASKTTKKVWLPLNFLKIGDEIVSYKLVGDATETNAFTLDCKLVRINNANPITTSDIAGGGIVQVDGDGNFDVEAVLSAVETVATDKQYVLEILGTTAVADTITVSGAEVKVNRKT